MARPQSIALAGFFKTPSHLLPRIAALLATPTTDDYNEVITYMDPCAGEAEAIVALAGTNRNIYACEMEATRHEKAKEALGWGRSRTLVHGDAFRVTFKKEDKDGVSVLFLNPPYDTDPVHGRLEQRFLERFTGALMEKGLLLFLVPFYALKASADLLAREYTELGCYRFPDGDFEVFKQVVLVARKSPTLHEPDPSIVAQVRAWSQDVSGVPELPQVGSTPIYRVATSKSYHDGLDEWKILPVDMRSLMGKLKPWHQSTRSGTVVPVPGIIPDLPVQDLLLRSYPVATPPRPAHIAAGIASGLFNGARIESENKALPPLLVKGVFDREYRTIEEKTNKDGEVRAQVQIQQPKLVTTVLDLNTHSYHMLKSGSDTTNSTDVSRMSVADLLKHYGMSLMSVMERQCPIMYDPRKDSHTVELASSPRKLFVAQAHATRAVVRLLGGQNASKRQRKGKAAILLGEIGSGKSSIAIMTAKTIKAKRPLIMCPPHLLQSWENEVAACAPDVAVRVLTSIADLEAVAADKSDRMIISVLSRETAKLSHGWVGVGDTCPKCGGSTPNVDLAKKRATCVEKTLLVQDKLAEQCMDYARKLSKFAPTSPVLSQILCGPQDRVRTEYHTKNHEAGQGDKFSGFAVGDLDHVTEAALLQFKDGNRKEAEKAIVLSLFLAGDEGRIETAARRVLELEFGGTSWESFGRALLLMLPPSGERQTAIVEELSQKSGSAYWNPWAGFKETADRTQVSGNKSKAGAYELSWETGVLTIEGRLPNDVGLACKLVHPFSKLGRFRWAEECGEFLYQAVPEPRRVALAQHISKRYPNTFDLLVLDECFVAGTKVSGVPIEQIKVGDLVDTFDESTKSVGRSRVTKKWIKTPSSLVRVSFHGAPSIICTPNHPVLTDSGWCPAGGLTGNVLVYTLSYASKIGTLGGGMSWVPDTNDSHRTENYKTSFEGLRLLQPNLRGESWSPPSSENLEGSLPLVQQKDNLEGEVSSGPQKAGLWVLQQSLRAEREERCHWESQQHRDQTKCSVLLRSHENQQPNVEPRDSRESISQSEGENVFGSRWKWSTYSTSTETSSSLELGHGVYNQHCHGTSPFQKSAELLQSGFSSPGIEAGSGSRRGESQAEKMEVSGPSKGRGLAGVRVDCVEVLEPGSDGRFGGLCTDGFVYNLEVEGTHTYFAEGILVHNCHEFANGDSAQGMSAHRLTALGIPTLMQTGTIMNGYAESLFANMWALSPAFRNEFDREERQRFIDRYGYRKRVIEDRDQKTGEVVEFGSQSDRVIRSERVVGNAPGILPLFLLRHLLPISVTLHKADLAIDLPACKQERNLVEPSVELMNRYQRLQRDLVARIKKDRFDPELAGKLFGQLAELPSYLDRATSDTGNCESGHFEIAYPESVGGHMVSAQAPLDSSTILPKEQWMLDTIVRELSEGRNVMVFSWHTNLLSRYARIISERIGEPVPILFADKVPTAKRQAWIDKEVVKKKRHILVTNPVCVQTGLNNLVHFASEIWMENPGCNGTIYRQGIGRVDRIGQKKETRIFSPVYAGTLQETLYDLLMKKVAVSTQTDGLDPEAALQAAGVGEDDYLAGLSIGKQLWSMLTEEDQHSRAA